MFSPGMEELQGAPVSPGLFCQLPFDLALSLAFASGITARSPVIQCNLTLQSNQATTFYDSSSIQHPSTLKVVGDLLYVNGADNVCVFNTNSLESLPGIGAEELAGASLSGMAHDTKSNFLWVTGADMVARIDLSHSPPSIVKSTGLVEKFQLHPNGAAVDPKNGALSSYQTVSPVELEKNLRRTYEELEKNLRRI
eukprot:1178483-Prorocentrum_minimum.AAC.8